MNIDGRTVNGSVEVVEPFNISKMTSTAANLSMGRGCAADKVTIGGLESLKMKKLNIAKQQGRAILTQREAQDIFKLKPSSTTKGRHRAGVLANFYGVSVKTVRDIWVGRTWYRATFHLDSSKPVSTERLEKKPGRPRGAKDSKPRSRKWSRHDSQGESKIFNVGPPRCSAELQKNFSSIASHSIHLPENAQSEFPKNAANYFDTTSAARKVSEVQYVANCAAAGASAATTPIEALLSGTAASSAFTDPFHDDWAFWTAEAEGNAALRTP